MNKTALKKTEGKHMAETEARKQWNKENVVFIATKLFRDNEKKKKDNDIIEYLKGKNVSEEIKAGLRLRIEQAKSEAGE